ncbi:uncharacterized protein PITG_11563 [Phytophthora infestans T30-4]|uniref:Uncharacterized protein n=1 Tax=Phytophthora infestans (strain T30-4) TaxID=403677 RepID=D0NI19_PHYIT|nr:uncharacterized protein PITG_11563 [Phytophthora infestans T30-4]EEY59104.1 conserved hypothetical protein [Phytophthora infestans T30-4]|eukprot:XP_002901118.1 conserved hypothetical protein [Phytophthora infestans T30-4]
MHTRVEALMAVVKDQQAQYSQASELLGARVTKYLAAQQAATEQPKANTSSMQLSRGLELQALQSELMELKSTVLDTYLQPRIVRKVVEVTKEIPIVLRPSGTTATERLAQGTEGKQNGVRDQTSMSPEEIAELFERGHVEEKLSTASTYRVLFATQ